MRSRAPSVLSIVQRLAWDTSLSLSRLASAPVALLTTYLLLIRPWHLRWGATDDEVARGLPGDGRVPRPVLQSTRAITIDAPPERIWPWLAQMGWQRAGWYTFPVLDSFDLKAPGGPRLGGPPVREIIPSLQDPQVGELLDPSGFRVASIEPKRELVLEVVGGVPGVPWLAGDSTWVFVLVPVDGGHTRLIERWRLAFPRTLPLLFFWGVVELVDFVMQRTQLRHIKQNVENTPVTRLSAEDASSKERT